MVEIYGVFWSGVKKYKPTAADETFTVHIDKTPDRCAGCGANHGDAPYRLLARTSGVVSEDRWFSSMSLAVEYARSTWGLP